MAKTETENKNRTISRSSVHASDHVVISNLFHPLTAKTYASGWFFKRDATVGDVFCLQKIIGKGGFSEVWLARYRNKPKEDPVAIKLLSKSLVPNSALVNEVSVLRALHNCYFIVQISSNFQTSKQYVRVVMKTHYGIVMKYATGGTLHERVKMIRRFSELTARFYAAEIAEGLFALHHRGVIHRDLNLDNVLIDETGHVLLSDFGLSLLCDPNNIAGVFDPWPEASKAQFPAPELLLGWDYDKTVDWWAFGIMLYRMVCGEYPFLQKSLKGVKIKDYSLELIYTKEIYPGYLSSHVKTMLGLGCYLCFYILASARHERYRHLWCWAGTQNRANIYFCVLKCGMANLYPVQLLTRRRNQRLGRGAYEENDVTNMDFFFNVDWCQLRERAVPAPFCDMGYQVMLPGHGIFTSKHPILL